MPSSRNLVVIRSDEHNPFVAGYAGHPVIQTPHLDLIAAAGVRIAAAYTPSPICVPARASFITGQPVHVHKAHIRKLIRDGDENFPRRAFRHSKYSATTLPHGCTLAPSGRDTQKAPDSRPFRTPAYQSNRSTVGSQ